MARYEIIVDLNDIKSIRKGERLKTMYENKGYSQVESRMLGMNKAIIVYEGASMPAASEYKIKIKITERGKDKFGRPFIKGTAYWNPTIWSPQSNELLAELRKRYGVESGSWINVGYDHLDFIGHGNEKELKPRR
jgi:hypothetical protein